MKDNTARNTTTNANATPAPAPDAAGTPANDRAATPPQVSLVSMPDPKPDAKAATTAPPSLGLTKHQRGEVTLASGLADHAARGPYAAPLAEAGVDAAFLQALGLRIKQLVAHGQAAKDCDSVGHDATDGEEQAARALVKNLQKIQSGARLRHLPDHPKLLEQYHVGERLDQSRSTLETASQNLIDKATAERPFGSDTDFINDTTEKRTVYTRTKSTQSGEVGKAKQARAQRDALTKKIRADRKKIQYAADTLWPSGNPANVQARSDFQLPPDRPFSH